MDNQPVPNSVPEPTLTSAQVPVSETKSKFSLVIPVLLVILLLLLGSTAFLYYQNQQLKSMLASYQSQATPTPSPAEASAQEGTANWKTYTNTTYGFVIDYPSTLEVRRDKDSSVEFIDKSTTSSRVNSDIKFTIGVNLISRDFNKIYSAQDNTIILSEAHAEGNKFTKVRNRTIGGYRAIDYISQRDLDPTYVVGSIIDKNGDLIEIWTVADSKSSYADFESTFNQILSTFKFTQ